LQGVRAQAEARSKQVGADLAKVTADLKVESEKKQQMEDNVSSKQAEIRQTEIEQKRVEDQIKLRQKEFQLKQDDLERLERVQKDKNSGLETKLGARLFGNVREEELKVDGLRIQKLRGDNHALEAKLGAQRMETTQLLA